MKLLIFIITLTIATITQAQQTKGLYNPDSNAAADITAAVKRAKIQHKFVIIQAGGNWCKWCKEFARFCTAVYLANLHTFLL